MKILAIGDLHVGSIYGLAPREFANNPFQQWAIEEFDGLIKSSMDIDYLVLLGDMVDGASHKDTTTLWETDVDTQVSHAVALLEPLKHGKHFKGILGVTGSGYHYGKGSGFDADAQVTKSLKGSHDKSHQLLQTPHGVIYFHHRSKNIQTELKIMHQRYYNDAVKIALLVGAHLHRAISLQDQGARIIHAPCWEYSMPFIGFGNTMSIGAVIIEVNKQGIYPSLITYPIPIAVEQEMCGYTTISDAQLRDRDTAKLKQLSKKAVVQSVNRKKSSSKSYLPPKINKK